MTLAQVVSRDHVYLVLRSGWQARRLISALAAGGCPRT
jgi:hypothetical protein